MINIDLLLTRPVRPKRSWNQLEKDADKLSHLMSESQRTASGVVILQLRTKEFNLKIVPTISLPDEDVLFHWEFGYGVQLVLSFPVYGEASAVGWVDNKAVEVSVQLGAFITWVQRAEQGIQYVESE